MATGGDETKTENVSKLCSMSVHLNSILAKEWHTDVTFLVGEENLKECKGKCGGGIQHVACYSSTLKAHRIILAIRSQVFEVMLMGDNSWIEKKNKPIQIPDVTPQAFQELLRFCYECHHPVQRPWKKLEDAFDVYYAADKYMLSELRQNCLDFLMSSLTSSERSAESACSVLQFADNFNIEELKEACLNTIVELYSVSAHVIRRVTNLTSKNLESILTRTPVDAYDEEEDEDEDQDEEDLESELFDALLHWAKTNCTANKMPVTGKNMRRVLGKNLYLVGYFTMKAKHFIEGAGASDIFTIEEKYAILANIISPESVKLPESLKEMPLEITDIRPAM